MTQDADWQWCWGFGIDPDEFFGPYRTQAHAIEVAIARAADCAFRTDDGQVILTVAEGRAERILDNALDADQPIGSWIMVTRNEEELLIPPDAIRENADQSRASASPQPDAALNVSIGLFERGIGGTGLGEIAPC